MAIPYIALIPEKRQKLRLLTSVLQVILSVCFFVIFTLEFFTHLISIKYGIRDLLAGRLVHLNNKCIILMIFSVPLFILHVFQIQLLLKQTEKRFQLSFKQLTEFMMVSATALACVLLMFMFSLSYTGRFRRVLAQALQERLLLTNTTTRDRIQNDFFCCGVNSFRDYLPESGIDRESLQFPMDPDVPPYYCHTQYTHFKHMCVAPPSCCLQAQCSTLIPYYIGFVETASQWYKRTGCLDSITQSFNYQLSSTPMTIFLFVVLLCEIASVISLQFTLSSFTLLKESDNDLTSGSFGWLLPIGYPSPMELIAEMQAPCQKQNQIELNEGLADATVNQTVGDKEETKKSMMTELMKSLKSKVSQVS